MKQKVFVASIIVAIVVMACVYNKERWYIGNVSQPVKEDKIPESDWITQASIRPGDTVNVIEVVLKEKYGGYKEVYCMVIRENKKTGQKKLVAPWFAGGFLVERGNLFTTEPRLIPKDEMKYDPRTKKKNDNRAD